MQGRVRPRVDPPSEETPLRCRPLLCADGENQSVLRPFCAMGAGGRKSARGLEGDFLRNSRNAIIALVLTWLCASEAHAQPISQEAGAALAKPPVTITSYPRPGGH